MAWKKAIILIGVAAGVFLLALAVRAIYQYCRYYSWQVQHPDVAILDQTPPQVKIVPARFSGQGDRVEANGRMLGIGQSMGDLLEIAYNTTRPRVSFTTEPPKGQYDFIANLPEDNVRALREEFENTFNVVSTKKEKREMDVLILTIRHINPAGLKSTASPKSRSWSEWYGNNYNCVNVPFFTFVSFLEQRFNLPVIDQTGLRGNYDVHMSWRRSYPETLKQSLVHDLGLEIHPARKQVEILIMEKPY